MSTAAERDALAQVMAADKEETTRQMLWDFVPMTVRRGTMAAAGLSPVMAGYTLDQFTGEQRRLIGATVESQINKFSMIVRAMGVGTEAAAARVAAREKKRLAELEAWAAEAHPSRSNLAH